jgi:type VI secretion system protein ImpF
MAKAKSELLITQSVVDRLTMVDEWPETRSASMHMYREALKRDVEWLLNTRQPILPDLDQYPAVAASVLNFGLPDIHNYDGSAGKDEGALTAAIEKTIKAFEPRIKNPRVYLTRADNLTRSIKFQIEGVIRYETTEEEIKFDTVLELISGEYEVK